MESTTSLSKGCFVFAPKSSKTKRKKRSEVKDEFDEYNSISQVAQFTEIISAIEKQLKEINTNASDEVLQELVQFVSKCPNSDFAIPTAVLLTGVNLPDHRVLFQALADRLHKETTKHVAVLLSSECTNVKNTIEQFTSQFLKQSTTSIDFQMDIDDSDSEEEDVFDDVKRSQCTMPNLVSWYEELTPQNDSPRKKTNNIPREKLVIIVPDFESFSTKVLQDVILILSGYLDRLPIVLVFGVATSVKALQSSLPHRITSRMDVRMFQSKQSVHFLNKTVNEVLLSWQNSRTYPFLLGPKMFKLLTDVFIFYDFSVHGFVQGVKYCLMEHFYNNPLARLCCSREDLAEVVDELKNEDLEQHFGNNKQFQAYVEKLPMQRMEKILSFTNKGKYFKELVLEMMNNLHIHKDNLLVAVWLLHTLVHDLPEAPLGKQVREVYIEAMSGPTLEHPKFQRCFELLNLMSKQDLVQKLTEILDILKESECLQVERNKLTELLKLLKSAGETLKSPTASPSKKPITMDTFNRSDRATFYMPLLKKNVREENEFEKARSNLLSYLKEVFKTYLISPTTLPLHEAVLIDNVSAKRHIIGAPRAALHTALNNPHHYLQCECCKISNNSEILSTMPDICIAYKLHLESGALINMYDWLQSFVTIVSPGEEDRDERKVDPAIQARFTRAVTELQFLGFIKGSKKKTDHVARLTWGGTC
ncbi:origin recognition complex subunit 3 [Macrosteles quadrilineatus]|uniref:origin recognition complex subunit 3 n=1 Tax=Macrosteles quadrilineatus TaxID=74068 RepID=UPI0023E28F7A|nr:origin recognition complex subunit 3 [Macrosteles quadrilineatus]